MGEGDAGVHITLREIYDSIQDIGQDVKSLESRLAAIEKQGEDIKTLKAEQRSMDKQLTVALDIAKDAKTLAEKHDGAISWLQRAVIGAFITAAITATVGLAFVLIQNAIIPDNTSNTKIEKQVPAGDESSSAGATK
ncbi:hypothetical protein [Weizmannia phage Youna2]